MAGACDVGARRAAPDVRAALRRYGQRLGMAFQVVDDVLDYTETETVTGKPSGLDLKEHKVTLPLIAAIPNMSESERATVSELMATPEPSDDLVVAVIGIVSDNGGLDAARERGFGLAREAERELQILPDSAAREALHHCLAYVVDRRS